MKTSVKWVLAGMSILALLISPDAVMSQVKPFHLEEASIDSVHQAIKNGDLTCSGLIQLYLKRIETYNKTLNAIIHINPDAMETARQLDASFAATNRLSGPIHCIPVAVKDAIDTAEMPTTGGSATPFGNPKPPDDSTVVDKLRKAGAIILAKSNLDEFARGSSGLSTLGGQVKNAYDTSRIPGGSSAGSAVAVASNLTMVALAEETGVSIRNPASNANIVGIAPTQGLVSRDGVIPVSFTQDRVGPYARTVRDAAILLGAIAGYDPKDPTTAASKGHVPQGGYVGFMNPNGLAGTRLGILKQFMTAWTAADQESVQIAEQAVEDMKKAGAEVIDVSSAIDLSLAEMLPYLDPAYLSSPAPYLDKSYLPNLDPTYTDPSRYPSAYYNPHPDFPFDVGFLVKTFADPKSTLLDPKRFPGFGINKTLSDARTNPFEFKYSFNRYLALRGDTNIRTLDDVINKPPRGSAETSGVFSLGTLKDDLKRDNGKTNLNDAFYLERLLRRKTHQEVVLKVLADFNLDALVYPMKTIPASLIGGRVAPSPPEFGSRPPSGNLLSSQTGLPSITMPAGFTTVVYDWVPDAIDSKKTILGNPVPARLPVAVEFLGAPFSEPTLLKLASGYESVTHHRSPPAGFPSLPGEP